MTEIFSLNPTPPNIPTPYDKDWWTFDDRTYENATLYVPEEALEAYKNTRYWKEFLHIKGFDPTGMKGIEADGNGKQKVYYDINGRRLSAPRKGLNIINGKKVIIK